METGPANRDSDRKPDWGVLAFLLCLLLIPLLAWYLLANWEGVSDGTPPAQREPEASSREGAASSRSEARRIARQNGERNARDYRRRLKRELEQAEEDLRQTRTQARLDPQPEMAEHWQTLLDEKQAARVDAARRLSDFEALMK